MLMVLVFLFFFFCILCLSSKTDEIGCVICLKVEQINQASFVIEFDDFCIINRSKPECLVNKRQPIYIKANFRRTENKFLDYINFRFRLNTHWSETKALFILSENKQKHFDYPLNK